MGEMTFSPPEPLTAAHRVADFKCGEPILDEWLHRRALANQETGASRSYVVVDETGKVVGYYALAAGALLAKEASGRVRRNMPDPIPVMVLGRLAVLTAHQNRGLGRDLLRDAVLRTLQAAEIAGFRALLVHALHEKAASFYVRSGFCPSPVRPLTLMLLLSDARAAMEGILP